MHLQPLDTRLGNDGDLGSSFAGPRKYIYDTAMTPILVKGECKEQVKAYS